MSVLLIGTLVVTLIVWRTYPETAHRELEDINPDDRDSISHPGFDGPTEVADRRWPSSDRRRDRDVLHEGDDGTARTRHASTVSSFLPGSPGRRVPMHADRPVNVATTSSIRRDERRTPLQAGHAISTTWR